MNGNIMSEEQNYKDFIEKESELVMKVNPKQSKLLSEYVLITKNLGEKGKMTVKEIHELYWDEKKNKYDKTLKTIYRYMDLLEENNIVQVSGHRKPKGSHLTEKLYCRTSMIYFEEEPERTQWWIEKEVMKQCELIWEVSKKYFGFEEEYRKGYAEILGSYYTEREEIIRELLEMVEGDKELAEKLKGISIMDFKSIFTTISMIKSFSKEGMARSKVDEII